MASPASPPPERARAAPSESLARSEAWRAATNGAGFLLVLGSLSTLGPLGTDINLPALPAIATALRASPSLVQLTLSSFLLSFGTGQLILGPLSDRYGRRPVLLGSMGLFALAGVACALASDVRMLIGLRFLQGMGASVGPVSARAIVRDVHSDRTRAASLQAYVTALQSLAVMAAPLLGAAVMAMLGWRWIYGFLGVCGVLLFAAVLVRLPETSPRASTGTMAGYRRVLRLPRTLALAAFVSFTWASYFPLLTSSPFVLAARFYVPTALFGVACAFMLGAFTAARVVRHVGAEALARGGAALVVLSGVMVWTVNWFVGSPQVFLGSMALYAFTLGIAIPNGFAAALADTGTDAGLASGILGAVQMVGGALGVGCVAYLPWSTPASAGLVALFASLAAGASFWWSCVRMRTARQSNDAVACAEATSTAKSDSAKSERLTEAAE